jgi:D-3-phosphoglycerate dehydrogenase
MAICLIVQPIHPVGLARLEAVGLTPKIATQADMETVAREIGNATAVITRSAGLSAGALDSAPTLRVVGSHGIGFDAIAVSHATALGIPVVNTPEANRGSVAEHTVALTLGVAKRLTSADAAARRVDFGFKYHSRLSDLSGKTLGLVGFGGIGRRVAAMMRSAFAMNVLVASNTQAHEARSLGYRIAPSLDALLAEADVVTLHRALRPGSRGLIGARELAMMKPTAILINTARGGLVDEMALADALDRSRIAGAGLDVFQDEGMSAEHCLLRLPNVLLSPHIAGSTDEALERTAIHVVERVSAVLAGAPKDLVNPEVWAHRRR